MTDLIYNISALALILVILVAIRLMGRVQTAVLGNRISALATLLAIVLTLIHEGILGLGALWICLLIGLVAGLYLTWRVQMIQMPQTVALLNGFGGASSALIAVVAWQEAGSFDLFFAVTAYLALLIGILTLTGSLIAAGKLHQVISQRPKQLPAHSHLIAGTVMLVAMACILGLFQLIPVGAVLIALTVLGGLFGVLFTMRIGGADMPVTISLLNALSGVAGSIAGMAIKNPLLVAAGSVVGASGLLLTQVMCRAMNRQLKSIVLGLTTVSTVPVGDDTPQRQAPAISSKDPYDEAADKLSRAKEVIIIPGYGMALAQAQHKVRQLSEALEQNGARVRFAIHPVAGRMPGHMNVLLAEVDIPYEQLYEMDVINPEFADCDVAVVVGANDVINPAANSAEGTPIYGMPVLDVAGARHLVICNFDLKPGYAGVKNPLYEANEKITLLLGDAAETVAKLHTELLSRGG